MPEPLSIFIVCTFLSGIGWLVKHTIESTRKAREQLQENRRQVYMKLLEPLIQILHKPSSNAKAMRRVGEFDYRKTMVEVKLMAPDDVVHAYHTFMKFSEKEDRDASGAVDAMGGCFSPSEKTWGTPTPH